MTAWTTDDAAAEALKRLRLKPELGRRLARAMNEGGASSADEMSRLAEEIVPVEIVGKKGTTRVELRGTFVRDSDGTTLELARTDIVGTRPAAADPTARSS